MAVHTYFFISSINNQQSTEVIQPAAGAGVRYIDYLFFLFNDDSGHSHSQTVSLERWSKLEGP